MSIIRVVRRHRNTVIDRATLRDEALSYRARGVLAYLLSHDEGPVNSADLSQGEGCEGRDAIRAALRELEAHRYLERDRKVRSEKGRWVTVTTVYESPRPTPENPSSEDGELSTGHRRLENRPSETRLSEDQALRPKTKPERDKPSLEDEDPNTPLANRMVKVCKGRHIRTEALEVIGFLTDFVDPRLVDEAIGHAEGLDIPPRRPRYFVPMVREQASRYGVAIPESRWEKEARAS